MVVNYFFAEIVGCAQSRNSQLLRVPMSTYEILRPRCTLSRMEAYFRFSKFEAINSHLLLSASKSWIRKPDFSLQSTELQRPTPQPNLFLTEEIIVAKSEKPYARSTSTSRFLFSSLSYYAVFILLFSTVVVVVSADECLHVSFWY